MITDENGAKHPETVEDDVQLRREEEQARKREEFWNRKAEREGWTRPKGDETKLDLAFRKRHREWYLNEPVRQEKKRPSLPIGLLMAMKEMDKEL